VRGLLRKRGIGPEEIDLVICATVTPDHVFPATANIITDKVGAVNAAGYDISAACSGFLFALVTGSAFITSGLYRKVVVVGADKMSSIVDYTDRTTCVLFGDGAGAVLLEPNTDGYGILDNILRSDGSGRKYLHQKAGGSVMPASHETVDQKLHVVFQDGQPVFKAAVVGMADVSEEIMKRNNLTADDVAYLVPHQANLRIIDATARRMGVGSDKVMINIQRYGNTTAATIPLCLHDWENQLKKGDNLILAAFGGGFTWGSIWVKWAYDPK
jgi:3-oxoacyl-[acyl-carrier-protein] synthase-3